MRKVIWGIWLVCILAIGLLPWVLNPLWRRFEACGQMFLTRHTFAQAAWWWRIDTAIHCVMVLSLLAWVEFTRRVWWPQRSPVWVPVAVTLLAVGDEVLQAFVPKRSCNLSDIAPGLVICLIWGVVCWWGRPGSADVPVGRGKN
jgi:hypothetical protein